MLTYFRSLVSSEYQIVIDEKRIVETADFQCSRTSYDIKNINSSPMLKWRNVTHTTYGILAPQTRTVSYYDYSPNYRTKTISTLEYEPRFTKDIQVIASGKNYLIKTKCQTENEINDLFLSLNDFTIKTIMGFNYTTLSNGQTYLVEIFEPGTISFESKIVLSLVTTMIVGVGSMICLESRPNTRRLL